MRLLKRALVSKTPLSDVFVFAWYDDMVHTPYFKSRQKGVLSKESEVCELAADKKMTMILFLSKSTKQVLHAKDGEDVPDFLFSFLTFPLGALPNIHKDVLSLGSIHQLQSSVSKLCVAQNQVRTAEHSALLLQPKLAPHYRWQNQMRKIEEGLHVTTVKSEIFFVLINQLCFLSLGKSFVLDF